MAAKKPAPKEQVVSARTASKIIHLNTRLNWAIFKAVNDRALSVLPSILARWLPDGRIEGVEWVARNPRRADQHAGSFKINLRTGRWSDFATGDRGGDVISLAAYLGGLSQGKAARALMQMLNMEAHDVG